MTSEDICKRRNMYGTETTLVEGIEMGISTQEKFIAGIREALWEIANQLAIINERQELCRTETTQGKNLVGRIPSRKRIAGGPKAATHRR